MSLAIILTTIICGTVVLLALMLGPIIGRDISARDRDRGLAKLYEARASLMFIEELERRAALRIRDAEEQRLREARERRRRERLCAEVRDEATESLEE